MKWILTLFLALAPLAACGGGGGDAAAADAALADAAPAGCPPCSPDSICVERYDGVCNVIFLDCVATDLTCPTDACSAECEQALCGDGPLQCETRPACGTEAAGAFTCYGP